MSDLISPDLIPKPELSEDGDRLAAAAAALNELLASRDGYTGAHTRRVSVYAVAIARFLEMSEGQIELLRISALLHDLGKIGISDSILQKPNSLDPAEWQVMRQHPEVGCDLLGSLTVQEDIADGLRYHHERWDGEGYPSGLRGEKIPKIARIIAVADAYDAMTSDRPYRSAMAAARARDEVLLGRGSQFDPAVVDAFLAAFKSGFLQNSN